METTGRRVVAALLIALALVPSGAPANRSGEVTGNARDPGEALAGLDDGAFEPHPYLVYALRAGVESAMGGGRLAKINRQGYRGAAVAHPKPAGVRRVLCLGGSETFGAGLAEGETSPALLARALAAPDPAARWEVANVAAPGYTSHEVAGSFALRWLDLEPDAIVIGDLAEDARALLTPGFRDDYGHVWKIWVRDASPPRAMRDRVIAAPVAPPAERGRALAAARTNAFETNLKFLLDVARGRGIRAVVRVPDPSRWSEPSAAKAVESLRAAALAIAASRGAEIVDESQPAIRAAAPAARETAAAHAIAGTLARMPW